MKEYNLNYKDYKLIILDKHIDNEQIHMYKSNIFNILTNAYKNIGGCAIYKDIKHMYQSVARYKIIIDNNTIIAAATYRKIDISYKCILIGGNNDVSNKVDKRTAVTYIIKSDIANFHKLYWIEASGLVTEWYKKYGAIKIPSVYAPEILGIDVNIIDDYSYSKKIKMGNGSYEYIKKELYGFPSKSYIEKILQDENGIKKYYNYIYDALTKPLYDSLQESINNNNIKEQAYKCLRTLNLIHDNYYESDMFKDVDIQTYKLIKKVLDISIKLYKNYNNDIKDILDNDLIILVIFIYKSINVITTNNYI